MPTPDVRVRLSAEGTAEVVAALKKVQAEGQKTSQAGGRSFLGFNSVLGGTTRLLAGLGVAIGVGSLVNFIRKSSEAADQIGKLGQKVGASVQNLSALNLAAATADVGTEQLTVGLTFLNRKLAELAEGSPKVQAMFRQIGLSAKDFKGKDAVQAFELVSQSVAKLGDGARKTATAVEIFGRSGAQLIPLMNDLAEEGLAPLIERARELGVLFDQKLVASVQKLNDDMKILHLQSQALGAQFATGISPHLSQTLQILTGSIGDTSEAWRTMGEAAGWLLKILTALGGSLVDLILLLSVDMAVGFGQQIQGIIRALKGDLAGAREAFNASATTFEERLEQMKSRWTIAFRLPEPAKPREGVPPDAEADPVALAHRQAEATKSIRDAELAYLKAQFKARLDAEKRSYEEGASSLQDYFDARRRIIAEEADAEVAALIARKALLSTETDEIKAQAEAKTIDIQVNKIRLEQEGQIAALNAEETRALRDLGAKSMEIERQLLEARGRRHEAAMQAIDEEIKKTDLLLRQQGMDDAKRTALLQQLRASMTASADFDVAQTQAQVVMTNLGLERQRIDAQIQAGLITQMQGERQLIALEQARLPILQESAEALMAAARASGDPERILQAREFALSIEEIAMASEGAATELVRLRDCLEQSGIEALTELFAEGIRAGQTFKNAIAEMALSVIQSIRRMVAEMMALKIMKALFSLGSSGAGAAGIEAIGGLATGATGGLVQSGRIARFSSGGFLRGPGTGTSDSLVALTAGGHPVRLSNGEFVVRAASVQQPGALEFLRDFNHWSMATLRSARPATTPLRFAEGGMVGAGAGGGGQSLDGRLTVGLDEGLVLKALETSRGQRILVETIGRNRRTLQRVLGG